MARHGIALEGEAVVAHGGEGEAATLGAHPVRRALEHESRGEVVEDRNEDGGGAIPVGELHDLEGVAGVTRDGVTKVRECVVAPAVLIIAPRLGCAERIRVGPLGIGGTERGEIGEETRLGDGVGRGEWCWRS